VSIFRRGPANYPEDHQADQLQLGDKIGPRIGRRGCLPEREDEDLWRYGKYYDQMKLNVAISSYGGQYWQSAGMP